MPIDAFFLAALTAELDAQLTGSRVDKIQQPGDSEILLTLRGFQGSRRLLLAAGASPRLHITARARENPASAPMFCMFLRKHLMNARLKALRQRPFERVVEMEFDTQDEMGIPSVKRLIAELMGRNANLALLSDDGRVLDCIRRQGLESPRPIQPGLFYRAPESRDKRVPFGVSAEEFSALCRENMSRKPEDFLMDTFSGFSPILAREAALDGWDGLAERFFTLTEVLENSRTHPVLFRKQDGQPKDFYLLEAEQYGTLYAVEPFDGTYSELLDLVCTEREIEAHLQQRVSSLRKAAKHSVERIRKKILLQQRDILEARDREKYRRWGDLLMANLHMPVRGESIEVDDFYAETAGEKAVVPLDAAKNLQQNAAHYYKTYRKLKNAEAMLQKQLEIAGDELAYWESVLEELSRVRSEKDIEEIREELSPPKRPNPKQKKPKPAQPQKFVSSTGIPFRAGRNNRQNDELTLHLANKNDIWLHAQRIPGCHVVIDTSQGSPDEQTILEAAAVAAYYSQASASPKVPVDFTRVKHVKKPSGAKPGMVIYTDFKTVQVSPDAGYSTR